MLSCKEDEINDIVILQKGLTNILFTFAVGGEHYIFRYPGDSSAFFIYRKNECIAQKIAAKVHADDTYVYIDESGVKISKKRKNCKNLNGVYYHDVELMKAVARKIRAFHDAGQDMQGWEEYNYDPVYQCERMFKEASKIRGGGISLKFLKKNGRWFASSKNMRIWIMLNIPCVTMISILTMSF